VIDLFCKASGLTLNPSKTSVLFEGLLEAELLPFKRLLPFSFNSLAGGFKYLGYHLKTGVQRVSDWDWIITKLSKKVGTWCNRWLSLGGRLILIKSVLEAQPVYWMALESLPSSVISRIRRVIFHFLWNGLSANTHYHLCRWEVLARPKKLGGWGLSNLLFLTKL
jgi:hypothetical protein